MLQGEIANILPQAAWGLTVVKIPLQCFCGVVVRLQHLTHYIIIKQLSGVLPVKQTTGNSINLPVICPIRRRLLKSRAKRDVQAQHVKITDSMLSALCSDILGRTANKVLTNQSMTSLAANGSIR